MNPLEFFLGKPKPSSGARPGWPPAPQGKFPSTWGAPKPSAPAPTASVGRGLVLNPITAAYSIPGFGEQKAQNRLDIMEMAAGPLNELRYMGGQFMQGRMPYSKPAVGNIPPSANGESYRDAELRLGNRGGSGGNAGYSTSTFIAPGAPQGGGFGGGRYQGTGSFTPLDPYAAQNREYERERARVEAMVKANPDMQKQAIADERAKVRDQGMALWAKANPTLAKQVQPGAVGYDAIQRGIGIQELPSLENRAEFTWNQATQGPTPAVPMADPMLNPAGPGFIGGEGAPPVNFADPRFENMSPEEFQKLLNQYTKR